MNEIADLVIELCRVINSSNELVVLQHILESDSFLGNFLNAVRMSPSACCMFVAMHNVRAYVFRS